MVTVPVERYWRACAELTDGSPHLALGPNTTKVAFLRTEFVTTFKRKATEIIADLESDPSPVLITQHGKPAAYLMTVEAFDSLHRRLGILEGIADGERAVEQGRVVTHTEAKKRMARWFR